MATIDVAMARSLRPGAWETVTDIIARSLVAHAQKRDLVGDTQQKVTDVKTAFSSWDNCMKASFCKWPVIAVIIIGSLIILAILWCIVRCACCAKSCCCGCFQCLKCCGNCCGCCDAPNDRRHKYLDEPYIPPHHGYQQQAPMQASYHPPPPQHVHEPPQYASFDTPKNQDSLPQMPSWEGAGSKKVMIEDDEAVEMDQLKKPAHNDPRNPAAGSPSAGVVSPMSAADGRGPYNPPNRGPGGPGGPGRGYMANNAAANGPGGYGQGHRPVSPLNEPGYGNNGYNQSGPGGPGGPGGYNNRGFDNGYNHGPGQNLNNLNPPNDYNSNRISDGYGLDQPYDSPDMNHGHPGAATMAGVGLAGGLAGAALAAGAMRHQSPAPGQHGYGTPTQQPASPYTELNAVPKNPFDQAPEGGYVEMPDEPRRKEPGVNVHAAFAEMSAEPTAKSPVHSEHPAEPEPVAFEMATDNQVAPIELDGGYVRPAEAKQAETSPHEHTAELPAQASAQSPTRQSPTAHSPTEQALHNAPEVYNPQQQPMGASGPAQPRYPGQPGQPQSRQGSMDSRSAPEGYGMRRQRTGDNGAPSPLGPQAPYGMDPRMRSSPAPMSPRSAGPRGSPGPGAGPRRGPGPRPDQPFSPSPLNTPAHSESPYGRPGYSQGPPPPGPGPNRTYSPAPRQPRSPDQNVPVGRPNGQTAFAEPQPQSPITNNAGFDFTSGFSRPQTGDGERRQQPGYGQPRPHNNQQQGGWN